MWQNLKRFVPCGMPGCANNQQPICNILAEGMCQLAPSDGTGYNAGAENDEPVSTDRGRGEL